MFAAFGLTRTLILKLHNNSNYWVATIVKKTFWLIGPYLPEIGCSESGPQFIHQQLIVRLPTFITVLLTPNAMVNSTAWLEQSCLLLNTSKIVAMFFSKSHRNFYVEPDVLVSGERLQIVSEYKYLGIFIDSKLTFTSHVKGSVIESNSTSVTSDTLAIICPHRQQKCTCTLWSCHISLTVYPFGHKLM